MIPTGFMALPADGEQLVGSLFRKLSLRVLGAILEASPLGLAAPLGRALARAQAILTDVARRHRKRLLAALRNPDVVAPMFAVESGMLALDDGLRIALPALLFELREVLPELVLWDVPVATVAGRRFAPPAKGLLAGPRSVEIRLHDDTQFELESALVPLTAAAHFAAVDSNPLSHLEAHPDKGGNTVDWGERSTAEWQRAFDEALELIAHALPALRAELDISLARVIPVGYEPEKHLSASYREAPGLIYKTLHPSALTMAEAIIHETQHSKLNALTWFDDVLHNGHTTWTDSPVRPDQRPLMGVLLAVHAFVPVAAFHAQLAETGHPLVTPVFARRRQEVLRSNRAGLATLQSLAEPTPTGARVLGALQEIHDATLRLCPIEDDRTGAMPVGALL